MQYFGKKQAHPTKQELDEASPLNNMGFRHNHIGLALNITTTIQQREQSSESISTKIEPDAVNQSFSRTK